MGIGPKRVWPTTDCRAMLNPMHNLPSSDFLMLQLKLKRIWGRKRLGQHFLTDEALLDRIALAARAGSGTLVVEIGPGPGLLTAKLAASAGAVLAIELDRRFKTLHNDVFGIFPQVRFIYADALQLKLPAVAARKRRARGLDEVVLAGNLPFQITSPLLFAQCGPNIPWQRMVVMVQREVADRILTGPGNKHYGALTVKLGTWWRVCDRWEVPAARFIPPPRVNASVLVLENKHPPAEPLEKAQSWWPGFSAFVDAAFGQRRKMLVNTLAGCWPDYPGKDEVSAALEQQGFSARVRAEEIGPEAMLALFRRLQE